jgi:hypothetical protein
VKKESSKETKGHTLVTHRVNPSQLASRLSINDSPNSEIDMSSSAYNSTLCQFFYRKSRDLVSSTSQRATKIDEK